ncbi:MAG: hypothetical protein CMP10_19895 [Zetaproteobacteria bacterium]|nr:hypothetical protein [Pseudobdellovibrionaceae bacterium]
MNSYSGSTLLYCYKKAEPNPKPWRWALPYPTSHHPKPTKRLSIKKTTINQAISRSSFAAICRSLGP